MDAGEAGDAMALAQARARRAVREEAAIAARQAARRDGTLRLGRALARDHDALASAALKIAAAADTARRLDVPFPHGAARDAVMALLAAAAARSGPRSAANAALELGAAWALAYAVEQDRLPEAEFLADFPFPDLEDAVEGLLKAHRLAAGVED